MKKTAILLCLVLSLCLCSCTVNLPVGDGTTAQALTYTLSTNPEKDFTLPLGAEHIDFTEYFLITTSEGDRILVTSSMLDLSQVNTAVAGSFTVTLSYRGEQCIATFTVTDGGNGGNTETPPQPTTYESIFEDEFLSVPTGAVGYTASGTANSFDSLRGVQYLQRDGEVTLTSAQSFSAVSCVTVVVATNCETGMKVSVKVGDTTLFAEGKTTVTVEKAQTSSTLTTLTFSSIALLSGEVSVTLTPTSTSKSMYITSVTVNGNGDDGGNGGNGGQSGNPNQMPAQVYDPSKMNTDTLADKLAEIDGYTGLAPEGTYSCLVVPVQFAGDKISANDLAKLNKAFNGTASDTGWESVSSYYEKSSYGKLHMSFDIQNVYATSKTASYYNNYSKTVDLGYGESKTQTGAELLLLEVLSKLEKEMDLTKYDYNGDGCIDGVYLIYSAPVDYQDADSIYWAYVDYYIASEEDNQTFDGLDAYYYLFAGFDFMDEDADTAQGYENMGIIPGMKINAATYIHETGHMLGMDDYYDYYPGEGSDEGLGGADMMDYTVGDHNPYTKLMMGWITPTIVTSTQTIDLSAFAETGECILIPLDFNHSYFCEYLLIDFYTATELNQLHGEQEISYLWDGAPFGVRIYHVAGWIDNPYADEFASVTNYNNSISDIALIKVIEADGTNRFSDSDGFAMAHDLWQAGDRLSEAFPTYTRADGKTLNFDILIDSADQNGATVIISFAK